MTRRRAWGVSEKDRNVAKLERNERREIRLGSRARTVRTENEDHHANRVAERARGWFTVELPAGMPTFRFFVV
jgi:hypothetical protein